MKITDIEVFPLGVGRRNRLVVKVELDEELVPQQEFQMWEPRQLHRRDGSFTNH